MPIRKYIRNKVNLEQIVKLIKSSFLN